MHFCHSSPQEYRKGNCNSSILWLFEDTLWPYDTETNYHCGTTKNAGGNREYECISHRSLPHFERSIFLDCMCRMRSFRRLTYRSLPCRGRGSASQHEDSGRRLDSAL